MLSISAIDMPLSRTCVRPLLRGLRLRLAMPKSGERPFLCMSVGERPLIGRGCQGRAQCGSLRCRAPDAMVRGASHDATGVARKHALRASPCGFRCVGIGDGEVMKAVLAAVVISC